MNYPYMSLQKIIYKITSFLKDEF